ncbi:hypothetical protein BV898_02571 [Hypsibius exemplaris]|uniref:Uncharacterized protein n=1 Tax=Hypsibius exemplaris TaxID=2072580 RepID=A0A1W0X7D8_HYPEX|nr:hypothetical protein BV898_02571 [Hypsibius exemplaris]
MKLSLTVGLAVVAVMLACSISQAEANCWNFVTGSRCDNENFWALFGYKRCNDNCKSKGYKSGQCVKSMETCLGVPKGSNVCKCN